MILVVYIIGMLNGCYVGVFSIRCGRWDCIDVGCANDLLFARQALRSNTNCLKVNLKGRKDLHPLFLVRDREIVEEVL